MNRRLTGLRIVERVVAFGLLLLLVSPVGASINLRPFVNDAGLFDPSWGPIKISFELRKDTSLVEVAVTDFRNQVVRHYSLVELRAGDHDVTWDGMNENGQRLADGPYQLLFRAHFKDGSEDIAEVKARIASVAEQTGGPVPDALPPEAHVYKIEGSVSSFWRHNNDRDKDQNEGEVRVRKRLSYAGDNRKVDAVFSAIKPFYEGEANYDGSHAMFEQHWGSGRLAGVFRDGLGSFDDPMKLFSDFKSERKKYGFKLEQSQGAAGTNALIFRSEGDVNTNEQGAAARVFYGHDDSWRVGSSYTYRKGRGTNRQGNSRNHAMALDVRLPVRETVAIVAESVRTSDSLLNNDFGYVVSAEYDYGPLRISNGFIDLGENFKAPFADPLRHVRGDVRGLEATLDYTMTESLYFLTTPALAMSYFDLKRHSDNERIREIDASLRFGLGAHDSIFLSWFGRAESGGDNHSFLGSLNHQWDDVWSSHLEGYYTFMSKNRTWR
ncbi:MAG: hypothetical protein JJV98_11725 [Desulfosarcina sp.]|nr:hypothetical protein [Desulfobacterales bacterium]